MAGGDVSGQRGQNLLVSEPLSKCNKKKMKINKLNDKKRSLHEDISVFIPPFLLMTKVGCGFLKATSQIARRNKKRVNLDSNQSPASAGDYTTIFTCL